MVRLLRQENTKEMPWPLMWWGGCNLVTRKKICGDELLLECFFWRGQNGKSRRVVVWLPYEKLYVHTISVDK